MFSRVVYRHKVKPMEAQPMEKRQLFLHILEDLEQEIDISL